MEYITTLYHPLMLACVLFPGFKCKNINTLRRKESFLTLPRQFIYKRLFSRPKPTMSIGAMLLSIRHIKGYFQGTKRMKYI